jgi:hypothetical protein
MITFDTDDTINGNGNGTNRSATLSTNELLISVCIPYTLLFIYFCITGMGNILLECKYIQAINSKNSYVDGWKERAHWV